MLENTFKDTFALVFLLLILIRQGLSQTQCIDFRSDCIPLVASVGNDCRILNTEQLTACQKTCSVCQSLQTPATIAPAWAFVPTVRATLAPIRTPPGSNSEDDISTSIPLWAVILIIIGLIALFIGGTCAVIRIKKRCKKWKMDRNHKLLMNAPPPKSTMPMGHLPSSVWQLENDGYRNYSYDPEQPTNRTLNRNLYLPENQSLNEPPNMVNNLGTRSEIKEKNTNALQNGSIKRMAPSPPLEDEKKQMNNEKRDSIKSTKSKAPEPPVQKKTSPKDHEVLEIPIDYSESLYSLPPVEEEKQKHENDEDASTLVSGNSDAPPLPPRLPLSAKASILSDATYTSVYKNQKSRKKRNQDSDSERQSSDDDGSESEMSSASDFTATTMTDQNFGNAALVQAMEKWKQHLTQQKKELEDYYSRLAIYVGKLALDQARSPPNQKKASVLDATWDAPILEKRATSMQYPARIDSEMSYDFPLKERALSQRFNFPEPPESIRGDFDIEPYNLESQQQVINGLKSKLSELHAVLKSTNDVVSEAQSAATWKPRDEFEIQQMMPSKPEVGRTALMEASETHFTIKYLLDQFERKNRIEVQIKIAEAFDNVRSRGGMAITDRDGAVTCLAKQVHHVMTDLLDPRTNTKLSLGALASLNLAMKMRRRFLKHLFPLITEYDARDEMNRNVEHVIVVCKQLLDMSSQLIARESSFRTKDYLVFSNTFVETAVKVMDETYNIKEDIAKMKKLRAELIKQQKPVEPPPQTNQNLTAADVRQLNEGLARLEAVLQGKLSGANPNSYPDRRHDEDDVSAVTGSELDTLTVYSCSTCVGPDTGYQERYPSHLTESAYGHPPNKLPKDGVQYTEVVFPKEKSRRNKNGIPKNEVLLNNSEVGLSNAPSSALDHRTNTIGASSFSFRTKSDLSKVEEHRQPRNEAMKGRYFEDNESPLPDSLTADVIPPLPRLPNKESSDSPAVQVLPCGLVANDTPPIGKIPEKKIRGKLGKIPTITVVRNGTEIDSTKKKDEKSKTQMPSITENSNFLPKENQPKQEIPTTEPKLTLEPTQSMKSTEKPLLNVELPKDEVEVSEPVQKDTEKENTMEELKSALASKFKSNPEDAGDDIKQPSDDTAQNEKVPSLADDKKLLKVEDENDDQSDREEPLFDYPASDIEENASLDTKVEDSRSNLDEEIAIDKDF